MLKAKGATPSPIHVRQEVLRNWFKTNPSSSVTLISFNTDISSPQTFKLANANELAKALRWINELRTVDQIDLKKATNGEEHISGHVCRKHFTFRLTG